MLQAKKIQVPVSPICDGNDFDSAIKLIYTSNGESANTMAIKKVNKDKFEVVENVPAKSGAGKICINVKRYTLYSPTADFSVPVAGSKRPPTVSGTFRMLAVK